VRANWWEIESEEIKKKKRKKNEKGIKKEGIVGFLVSPRQIKIKPCRAICLLQKLSGMTIYTKYIYIYPQG
jgi:hypothetical protein